MKAAALLALLAAVLVLGSAVQVRFCFFEGEEAAFFEQWPPRKRAPDSSFRWPIGSRIGASTFAFPPFLPFERGLTYKLHAWAPGGRELMRILARFWREKFFVLETRHRFCPPPPSSSALSVLFFQVANSGGCLLSARFFLVSGPRTESRNSGCAGEEARRSARADGVGRQRSETREATRSERANERARCFPFIIFTPCPLFLSFALTCCVKHSFPFFLSLARFPPALRPQLPPTNQN